MATGKRVPKRVSNAVLQSLLGGVVPTVGLEHIAVGREKELEALTKDLDTVADGGASFRVLMGRYGSGKTFLGQMLRERALQRNFVVMQADLSQNARFSGSAGQGQMLYRALLASTATKTRASGNAMSALLERWLSALQNQVEREDGIGHLEQEFRKKVEERIGDSLDQLEGMIHSHDFARVIRTYLDGHLEGDDARRDAAMRWLRGEYDSKREVKRDLGVSVLVGGTGWYNYIRLLAHFARQIGYRGLILFVDELDHIYKLSNRQARDNNYERLLHLYNDTTQGHASNLGIVLGATLQVVEDKRRGMYSNEALRTRLQESSLVGAGMRDLAAPLIRLEPLDRDDILLLLENLLNVHALHYKWVPELSDSQRERFLDHLMHRPGADSLLTPREIVRDYLTVLNLLQQNPERGLDDILGGQDFQPSQPQQDPLLSLTGESRNGVVDERFTSFEL